jgi:hypothetical protein
MAQLRLPAAGRLLLAAMLNVVAVTSASAHVKWFCGFDIAGQPEGLENVLCPDFELLIGFSIVALLVGGVLEATFLGEAMLRALDRATSFVRVNSDIMMRAATAFFFIAIWAFGGVLLTPELKTDSTAVAIVQLSIAAGMLSRRTMPLSAVGIYVIFVVALWNYGPFHLADYPIFLGVAAFLALTGLQQTFFGLSPTDVARWSAGITLMWASIEKWAYPGWSYPLFVEHPALSLGFSPEFYMRAAGAVEFALAFSLIWTPLVRRAGALMLLPMFVGAVISFGKIDLIGHTLIVAVLLAVAAESSPRKALVHRPYLIPVAYATCLCLFLGSYYLAHAAIFGTAII